MGIISKAKQMDEFAEWVLLRLGQIADSKGAAQDFFKSEEYLKKIAENNLDEAEAINVLLVSSVIAGLIKADVAALTFAQQGTQLALNGIIFEKSFSLAQKLLLEGKYREAIPVIYTCLGSALNFINNIPGIPIAVKRQLTAGAAIFSITGVITELC